MGDRPQDFTMGHPMACCTLRIVLSMMVAGLAKSVALPCYAARVMMHYPARIPDTPFRALEEKSNGVKVRALTGRVKNVIGSNRVP